MYIIKRKFKLSWSPILAISTKWTTTSNYWTQKDHNTWRWKSRFKGHVQKPGNSTTNIRHIY